MINAREETTAGKGMARKGITGCGMRDAIFNTVMREGCKDKVMFEWILNVEKEGSYGNNDTDCISGRGSSRHEDWGQRLDGLRNSKQGTFLVVQWLRIHLVMQGTWVWSLVGELRSHMSWDLAHSGAHMEPEWMIRMLQQRCYMLQLRPDAAK